MVVPDVGCIAQRQHGPSRPCTKTWPICGLPYLEKGADMATMKSPALVSRPQFSKIPIPPQLAKMRPRFLRELVLVTTRDELVVDGTSHLQILQGKSTRSLVHGLIPLMDGTRTLQELEGAAPGVPAEHVRSAVNLLFNCGLIEDGVADQDASANLETLTCFRRYVGITRANRNGQEAYEKLQASEVVILTSGGREDQVLKSVLEQTGLGRVVLLDRKLLNTWRPETGVPPRQSISISLSFGPEDYEWH